MATKETYRLVHREAREGATQAILNAPNGFIVTINEPTRSLQQSAKLHACFNDISRSGFRWAGKHLTSEQWKVLLISGHNIVTGNGAEIVEGIEGELVNVRESTAAMSIKRMASLLEYVQAFMSEHGIPSRAYGPNYD